jgi:hypothetical protein
VNQAGEKKQKKQETNEAEPNSFCTQRRDVTFATSLPDGWLSDIPSAFVGQNNGTDHKKPGGSGPNSTGGSIHFVSSCTLFLTTLYQC